MTSLDNDIIMHNASSNDWVWYIKCIDSNKTMSFKVSDKKTVKKVY